MFHVNHREFFECKLCGLDVVQDRSICLAHCKIKCHICVGVQVSAPKLRFKRNSIYVIKSDPKSSLTCQAEGWQELASALTAQGYTNLGWSGGPSDNAFVCAGYHWNPLAQPHVPSIPGTRTDGAPGPRVKSPWVQNATFDPWEFAVFPGRSGTRWWVFCSLKASWASPPSAGMGTFSSLPQCCSELLLCPVPYPLRDTRCHLFNSSRFWITKYKYIYIYPLFFRFFSHIGHYRVLSRIPCAIQ